MSSQANPNELSEADVKEQFISPNIQAKNWQSGSNYCMEYSFTDGRVITDGRAAQRMDKKFADYYLYKGQKSQPLTIIEAKKLSVDLTTGIQQAIEYAKMLDLHIVYASNGTMFREHDLLTGEERDFPLDQFPTPDELEQRIIQERHLTDDVKKIVETPYYYSQGSKEPRYYQRIAIDRTVEAIAKGEQRILLVMATGTGKTFTAFQILWRLRAAGLKKRILYIADRNILIDQTMKQDFAPFSKVMTKVQDKTLEAAYEIHMALYQQLISADENKPDTFTQFSLDFFDLIVVDECHRGSARENSAWRKVLTYFHSATQIGLTATPKQTNEANNFDYFGDPIYTYSLKQGIEDGFLAPYTVDKVFFNIDQIGLETKRDIILRQGTNEIKEFYSRADFGREITVEERQKQVADKITKKLHEIGRMTKTIIFCPDVNEAGHMRDLLIERNKDLVKKHDRYIMRICGEDYQEKQQLDNFIDPDSQEPVVVTTSELLSTGVDCKTCGLIVIDKEINSMTVFKQIIGRGTRLYESKNKLFFHILDFRGATALFADPDFDGESVTLPPSDIIVDPPRPGEDGGNGGKTGTGQGTGQPPRQPRTKHIFKGKNVEIQGETVSIIGIDGKALETINVRDFTKRNITEKYRSMDDFINNWNAADRHNAILYELKQNAIFIDSIREANPVLKDYDIFDVICHVAFDAKPLTRRERADNVRKRNYLNKYQGKAREVLEALLDKYSDQGLLNIEDIKMLELSPFKQIGTPVGITNLFGGPQGYIDAVKELEQQIHAA